MILNVFFLFGITFLFVFYVDGAHAELVVINKVQNKMINDGAKYVNGLMLRDPTKPLHYVNKIPAITESLTLQAVFIRSNNRSAIINGQHVNIGDVVSNYRVIAIGENLARLEKNNEKITLYLRGDTRNVKP